jgi:hypothetical protein
VNLADLAELCSQLFVAYHGKHPDATARARLDARQPH